MRFELGQRIHRPLELVVAAFVDPRFYEMLDALPNLGRPELLTHEVDGTSAHLRIRHHFTGHLSAAVRAAVDPQKLSWVEDAHHDLAAHRVRFTMLPDHYADRFRCSGSYRFVAAGASATDRTCAGDLQVRMPLVGRRVETAIVSGLREHLEVEAEVIEEFIPETAG